MKSWLSGGGGSCWISLAEHLSGEALTPEADTSSADRMYVRRGEIWAGEHPITESAIDSSFFVHHTHHLIGRFS